MPRIPYPDPSKLSPAVRSAVGTKPPNVSRMLATASEAVYKGYSAFGTALLNDSPLPAKLREIAILRVGYLSNATYEVFQHEALARYVGLSEEQIGAIRAGGAASAKLGPAGAAVLAYTDDLVTNVRPSDATLNDVRKHLNDTELVDLTLVTGAYMMVCRFLEATGVENDAEPIDWKQTLHSKG